MMAMNQSVPSVSQLVGLIKRNLEGQFSNVTVVGEISNLSLSSSGHWYLSLSDQDSLISAAIFKMDAMRNMSLKNLKDGDKVICSGAISVYPKRGTFQLIVKRITAVGKGDLKEQFEQLKLRLSAQGLFDLEVKNTIPKLPKRIAVITAQGAAALADFLNIIQRRSLYCDILISPALVQGETAPKSIRAALEKIIRYDMQQKSSGKLDKQIDVIVITRGGGSMEDLWAFNDEALAYDIYNCPIPIISAVGHQVDYTICDFVSDLRAETPSAAAEILSNEQTEIALRLDNFKKRMISSVTKKLQYNSISLNKKSPLVILDKLSRRIKNFQMQLERNNVFNRKVELLSIANNYFELDILITKIKTLIHKKMNSSLTKLESTNNVLAALNPKNILSRGYSYVETSSGVMASAKDFAALESGTKLKLHFMDGVGVVEKVKNE